MRGRRLFALSVSFVIAVSSLFVVRDAPPTVAYEFPCRYRTELRARVRDPEGDWSRVLTVARANRLWGRYRAHEAAEIRGGDDVSAELAYQYVAWSVEWGHASPQEVEELIRCHAPHYGVDPDKSVAVASCESGMRWEAENGVYKSIFQHHKDYWPARAENYGLGGASIWDVYAQVHVTHNMVHDGGWGPWSCA